MAGLNSGGVEEYVDVVVWDGGVRRVGGEFGGSLEEGFVMGDWGEVDGGRESEEELWQEGGD